MLNKIEKKFFDSYLIQISDFLDSICHDAT